MKHIVVTQKSIDQVSKDLEAAVIRNKFGVLHIHDLKATMKNKGVDFPAARRQAFELEIFLKIHEFRSDLWKIQPTYIKNT
ncbi:MAG: hypothetical protein H8D87_21295 [Deltaproteobacteria bacterium]|uniref:hypothetical protein n=1 Tax=Desulfobacula sp. TaxID=2593537 RepID=UPI0019ABC336|nr:hypothetical protein [Candidatus Desulfobacula maris]MBL6996064.1 hypothetical protein [Desulfobacula sp.]